MYEGYFNEDSMNGRGRLIMEDGSWYEGEWLNNKVHGHGMLTYEGGSYEGEWVDGIQ
jgi:hypothetical protein